MKRSIFSFLFCLCMAAGVAAQKPETGSPAKADAKPVANAKLPDVKTVIEKYIAAVGGRDVRAKTKTRYQKSTITIQPMGVSGTAETFARNDGNVLSKVTMAGIGELLDGFDGKIAWTLNPIQGARIKQGAEFEQVKRSSRFDRDIAWDSMYTKLVVRGIERIGESDAYVVVASYAGVPDDVYYFDTKSGLLLRSDTVTIAPEGQQAVSSIYSDYRAVDGVLYPFRSISKTPQFEIHTELLEVKHDVPMDDKIFVQPK